MRHPPIGTRHGRLTILEAIPGGKHPKVRGRCDCGVEKTIQVDNLMRTHSCGCIKREMLQAKATHHMSNSREYRIWAGMKDRCSRPTQKAFPQYGGRGITVCERWVNSFENFFSDMGPAPSNRHSIDRFPNRAGNYEPSNCRWATPREQRLNQPKGVRGWTARKLKVKQV